MYPNREKCEKVVQKMGGFEMKIDAGVLEI
jgi:hypothetical protein